MNLLPYLNEYRNNGFNGLLHHRETVLIINPEYGAPHKGKDVHDVVDKSSREQHGSMREQVQTVLACLQILGALKTAHQQLDVKLLF